MKKIIILLFICFLSGLFTGCAAKQQRKIITPAYTQVPPIKIPTSIPGSYHIIKKNETLWKISRIYGVDLNELVLFNKISNACKIEVGEKVFIPDYMRKSELNINAADKKPEFIWPCKGLIVSCFNQLKQSVKNQGIDILARPGDEIIASAGGCIIFTSENMRGYGKAIIIQHGGEFTSVYTQNEQNFVKVGDYVKQGQLIARAGATGRTSQCLVHFEIRKNNKPQNPLLYLP
ncbi:MAG: peptidoglycan DD-metalloendopeptidase family protein [Candidatus Omnitrophica bacterium]|nr:peptidoglycan DD-metalloendopeptidase family protein [Candidatus Omnitrophota bacterium]